MEDRWICQRRGWLSLMTPLRGAGRGQCVTAEGRLSPTIEYLEVLMTLSWRYRMARRQASRSAKSPGAGINAPPASL